MIENITIALFIASLIFMVHKANFVQKQSPVRILVRMETDDTVRRIRIRHR